MRHDLAAVRLQGCGSYPEANTLALNVEHEHRYWRASLRAPSLSRPPLVGRPLATMKRSRSFVRLFASCPTKRHCPNEFPICLS